MPLMDELAGKYVTKEVVIGFFDTESNKKAKDDFCYLVNKSGLSYYVRLGHICISGSSAKLLGDCVVCGATSKMSEVEIPKAEMNVAEAGKVAVVVYDADAVSGVYVFDMETVKTSTGLFSRFKDLKKKDMYGIKLNGIEKCIDNKFGVVFSEYIKV